MILSMLEKRSKVIYMIYIYMIYIYILQFQLSIEKIKRKKQQKSGNILFAWRSPQITQRIWNRTISNQDILSDFLKEPCFRPGYSIFHENKVPLLNSWVKAWYCLKFLNQTAGPDWRKDSRKTHRRATTL